MRDESMGEETRDFLEQHFPPSCIDEWKARAHALAGSRAGQIDPSGLVIDAILHVARHHRDLRDVANVKAWFRTILVREVLARLKLACHRLTRTVGDDYLHHLPDRREPSEEVEREDEMLRARAFLGQLLPRLSEADQEVICLSRLEGLPDQEVAALLDISESALRQRRSRALRRLLALAKKNGLPPG